MKLELKNKWIEALRSGEYRQGRYQLKDFNGNFCCLGVLCDLIDNSKWTKLEPYDYVRYTFSDGLPRNNTIPNEEACQIGLDVMAKQLLVQMNDSGVKDFEDIADWILLNVEVEE